MKERRVGLSLVGAMVTMSLVLALSTGSGGRAGAASPPAGWGGDIPLAQQFQDVPDSNPFAPFINALKIDNIIGGYLCGGPGEPCVPPANLPYFRPNVTVTRAQMSKFVDNGRRNIEDAVGLRLSMTNPVQTALTISSTTTNSIDVNNASGSNGVQSTCTRPDQNCWAFYGVAAAGNMSANFEGGRGAYAHSIDSGFSGLEAGAAASSSYGMDAFSDQYRAGYVKSLSTNFFSLEVAAQGGITQTTAALDVAGGARVQGTLYALGGCTGCLMSDIVQNVGADTLEAGDVVAIVGTAAPVMGDTPVVTVRKASSAYQTSVFGIVDRPLYVPNAATRQAYETQEQARKAALDRARPDRAG